MTDWLFQYKELIDSLDDFALQSKNVEYQKAWRYTKAMISAHAFAIRPPDISDEEALSVAWAQFECTFDEDEDNALLSLAGIIANLVNCVPLGQGSAFHEAIEVAFARARGFSKEEAVNQHREWMAANPDAWESFSEDLEEQRRSDRETLRSQLQIIEGGKGK
jgi:hypothetical protein